MRQRESEVEPVEDDALRALHDAHASVLRGYVRRLTGDEARADDIVQETMIRAWKHGIADSPTGSRAWLFTVARNLVIDDARSARSRHERPTDDVLDRGQDDQTDALFDAMLIADALHSLSPDHRAVVVLAYYRRLSVAEISDELDVPPGTVKSRLHYGLRNLRLALQERGVSHV
ncbi:MAG: sigma-70 family RNA polymerase sigma factor [Marmoricola sp.]